MNKKDLLSKSMTINFEDIVVYDDFIKFISIFSNKAYRINK